MIARTVSWAVDKRSLVLLLAAALGGFSLYWLPIDAVPDITINQVQIIVRAPALSPQLLENQVSFPIETGLAGIPGLNMPACSAPTVSPKSPPSSRISPTSTSRVSRSASGSRS